MSDKYRKLTNVNNHIEGADVHMFIPTEEAKIAMDDMSHDAGQSLELKKYLKEHDRHR